MTFRFIEDVAIADLAFEAESDSLDGLFEEAGKAVADIMVDPRTVKAAKEKTIKVESDSLENLMYDFLSEIIYIKDTENFLAREIKVKADESENTLSALLKGETIDRKRHDLRNDLKAITMHMFYVKKENGKWKARVVVDI